MKLFLCGQGPAAEAILRIHLASVKYEGLAVFTHPGASIFGMAQAWELPVSLESVNTVSAWPFQPDVIVSVYYRTIIRQHVIDRVHGKIFNAHTSLLPRHRGRSPIPWAIVEGDRQTGITYHYIDAGIDTGRVILQAVCQISSTETQTSLFEKINDLAIAYFPGALALVLAGFAGVEQQGQALYHFAGPPHDGQIDPGWTHGKIERFIRAMTYPPLPYARLDGREVRSMADYYEVLNERGKSRHNLALPQ